MFTNKYRIKHHSLSQSDLDFNGVGQHVESFAKILLMLHLDRADEGWDVMHQNSNFVTQCFEYISLFEYFDIILKCDEDLEDRRTMRRIELSLLRDNRFHLRIYFAKRKYGYIFPKNVRELLAETSWEMEVKTNHKGIVFQIGATTNCQMNKS